MNLNLLHIHGRRADGHSHVDAVAGDGGHIGGHKAREFRLERGHAVQIGAEAAAGQNDGLGADGVFAVLILDLHADSLAVFHDQLGGGGVGAQVDLILGLHIGGQHFDQIRADRGGLAVLGGGAVNALDARAAERADVGQMRVLGGQPVDGFGRVAGQSHDQIQVVQAFAADHGIQREQLDGIKVAGRVRLVCLKLGFDSRDQIADLVAILFLRGRDSLFHGRRGRVRPFVFILIGGLRGVHAAGCAAGVAAGGAALFHDDDTVHAGIDGLKRSGHARAARADDHHVALGVRHGGIFSLDETGRRHGLFRRVLDGVARHGRAGDAVKIHALRGDNRIGIRAVGARLIADALGLVFADDLSRRDLAVFHGQGDGNFADALRGAGIRLSRSGGDRAGRHQHGQKNGCKFLHEV